jgi:site-specific recombinase XerD
MWGGFMRKEDYPYRDGYFEFLHLERGVSTRTVDSYNFDLELFFGYLDYATGGVGLEPDQIEPADLVGFFNAMSDRRGNQSRTRNRKLAALRSYFSYLELYKLLKGQPSPIKRFQCSKISKRLPVYLTPEEVKGFLEASFSGRYPHRDYAMFLLVLQTGCRIGELLEMKVQDFDFLDLTVKVIGKGNKERQLPLTKKTAQALEAYLNCKWRAPKNKNEQMVFLNKNREPISRRGIQKCFEQVCDKAGLNRPGLSIHKLRHTCLTLLLQEGVDLITLQMLAGHEEIGTTAIYLHVSSEQTETVMVNHPLG